MEDNALPSRTSILTAAARAFGSREPDASVRNPDWVADRLISPAELALIAEHPISKALDQDFQKAIFAYQKAIEASPHFTCIDELLAALIAHH